MTMQRATITSLALIIASLFVSACSSAPPHPIAAQIDQYMVKVDGGAFVMGSNSATAAKSEMPAREVNVDSFYLAKFEVTQALFHEVMGSSQSYFRAPTIPVNNISWQQAEFFIQQLNTLTGENYRLPTEAEWEFAANGGRLSNNFTYAGSNNINDVAWHAGNSNNRAHPVGQKQPNELGLYDMTGNVGEFVADAFDDTFYRYGTTDNPNNVQDEEFGLAHKSVRGGSFAYDEEYSENFRRDFAAQRVMMADMGLRLAKDAN